MYIYKFVIRVLDKVKKVSLWLKNQSMKQTAHVAIYISTVFENELLDFQVILEPPYVTLKNHSIYYCKSSNYQVILQNLIAFYSGNY